MNGNDLYAYCQDKDGSYGSIFCHAYIIGAADIVLGIGERNETAYGYQACPTNGITEGQVTDIVILWLRKNPSARHYGASSLVASALYESFPCR